MKSSRTRTASVRQGASLAVMMLLAFAPSTGPAAAQAVVTAVNGDPVTTFDIDEYTKILKLEHKAAARADALEAVVEDHLKYDEARHWGIDGSDADVSTTLTKVAADAKMDAQGFSEAAAKNKIDLDTIRNHLRAIAAWDNLVRARNKGIGATDEEINAEIAKGHVDAVTNYRLQQVIFVLPANASPATIEGRVQEARALRNRFDGCDTGLQLARSLPDVAVKEGTSRTSDALSAGLRKVLAATPRGMLTPPERGTSGVEMVAVCEKNDASDLTTLHDRVQKSLITAKLTSVSAKMYKDLRGTAVVSKN
jgi:peptidyl-prolyl cis-trans isomerase SurA